MLSPNKNAYLAVAFTPMHGMDYVEDNFLAGNAGTLGFFLFISSLIPVVRLIARIVTDKETKMRESMSMMGLTDTGFWLSWYITYFIIYLIITLLAVLITSWSLFPYSNPFIIFLMFFLYGLSCIGFSMLISAFFSRAKTAILIGVLCFFVTYFATASFDENTPYGTKAGLSIFNTVAMNVGFQTLLSFEASQ
jgi:ATP-binding cassette subfamily A (ABC1) protein 3